ncbi:MAG: hypothetical protein ACRC35_06105 [Angustibacter sp.]
MQHSSAAEIQPEASAAETRPALAPWIRYAVAAGPGVALAVAGLTHPTKLDDTTAGWWRDLHVVLLPLFPLLALAPWLLAREYSRRTGWLVAALGFTYACSYTALDVLAGIGAGAMQQRRVYPGVGVAFDQANQLVQVGVYAYLVAGIVAATTVARRVGARALPGGALVIAAAVSFLTSHVWWPRGVLTMLAAAAGWTALAWASRRAP